MTVLLTYAESEPTRVLDATRHPGEIGERLGPHGLLFERWTPAAEARLGATTHAPASEADVLTAYGQEIERLKHARGYLSHDVVRMQREPGDSAWPVKAQAARAKFLEEHRHAEDEVRFFVAGTGLFSLRLSGYVFQLLCGQGDLLSVPAGTRHWFDMGSKPSFCALRLFRSPEGWVASFTGDAIANRFPSYDELAAQWR